MVPAPEGRTRTSRPSLPEPDVLAVLVTNVTDAMIGLQFEVDWASHAVDRTYGRSALVRIRGARPISIVIASDDRGATSLGAAFFACSEEEMDRIRVDDALMELANMTAGQIRIAMQLDEVLGVPRIVSPEEAHGGHQRRRVVLRSGSIELALVMWDSPDPGGRR